MTALGNKPHFSALPLSEDMSWHAQAPCAGLSPYFDLLGLHDGYSPAEVRDINSARLQAARPICNQCPFFENCFRELVKFRELGVIRCGHAFGTTKKVTDHALERLRRKLVAEHRLTSVEFLYDGRHHLLGEED